MALACLAAEAEHAGDKLARRGYALIDGSAGATAATRASFDTLLAGTTESARLAPDHPLVARLLGQPAVREVVTAALGPAARALRAVAADEAGRSSRFLPWRQAAGDASIEQLSHRLVLRWHLDLIGPADGGLRVLPGSHTKGRLTAEEIAALAKEAPTVELAVSAGTVLAFRPLLVHGARRRSTQGHRRILQVELAAGEASAPSQWTRQ